MYPRFFLFAVWSCKINLHPLWAYAYISMYINDEYNVARPKCCRTVEFLPTISCFVPMDNYSDNYPSVVLSVDELEAIRLADYDGLSHELAGNRMNISRQTFGRVIETARKKVAESLTNGIALKIEGGNFAIHEIRTFVCMKCEHHWDVSCSKGRPKQCPECGNKSFHCIKK